MTTSAGSATPGQWKEVTVRHLRKVWDALQRATALGPSRSVARNISMERQFCGALFGENDRKSRDAGSAGRKRRPFSRAAPGRPGLLRGDFPHASVRRGSRQSPTAARSPVAADPTAGEPAGRCLRDVARRPERCPIRLRKQGIGGRRQPQGAGHRTACKRCSFPRENPDEPTNLKSGRRACCASSEVFLADGGLAPTAMAGHRPGSDTQRSSPHQRAGVLLGGRASGLR